MPHGFNAKRGFDHAYTALRDAGQAVAAGIGAQAIDVGDTQAGVVKCCAAGIDAECSRAVHEFATDSRLPDAGDRDTVFVFVAMAQHARCAAWRRQWIGNRP